MNIQCFIFNWLDKAENTTEIETTISDINIDVSVVNSGVNSHNDNWIDIGSEAHFSDQFRTCLDSIDNDKYLLHIQGDTSYENWPGFISDAEYYMKKYNAGIYYPHIRNQYWSLRKNSEIDIETDDHNIIHVACGDETVWVIAPEILKYISDYNIRECFDHDKYGYGWDLCICSISFLLGLPVIRDLNHLIEHPRGCGYNKRQASESLEITMNKLPENISSIISDIWNDRDNISQHLPKT